MEEAKAVNGDGRLGCGQWAQTPCADDVLLTHALETGVVLRTSHPCQFTDK